MNIGGGAGPPPQKAAPPLVGRVTRAPAGPQPRPRRPAPAPPQKGPETPAPAPRRPAPGGAKRAGDPWGVVLGGVLAKWAAAVLGVGVGGVDLGRDGACVAAILPRQPELHVGLLEERIALGRERLLPLQDQW